jgi:hypothetical protein
VHAASRVLDSQVRSPWWKLALECSERCRVATDGLPEVFTYCAADRDEAGDHPVSQLLRAVDDRDDRWSEARCRKIARRQKPRGDEFGLMPLLLAPPLARVTAS